SGTLSAALGWCLVLGFGLVLVFSTGQAFTQLSADDHNRGVILGIWSMVLCGAQPLGNLLAGLSADRWNVSAVLVGEAAGAAVGAMVGLGGWSAPERRRA